MEVPRTLLTFAIDRKLREVRPGRVLRGAEVVDMLLDLRSVIDDLGRLPWQEMQAPRPPQHGRSARLMKRARRSLHPST